MIPKQIPNIDRGYHAAFKVCESKDILRLKRSNLMNLSVTKKQISAMTYVKQESQ